MPSLWNRPRTSLSDLSDRSVARRESARSERNEEIRRSSDGGVSRPSIDDDDDWSGRVAARYEAIDRRFTEALFPERRFASALSSADNTSRRADSNEDHGARPFFDRPRNNWVALRVSNSDSLEDGTTRASRSSRRREAATERPLAETLDRRAKAALSSWLAKDKDGPLTRQSLIEALAPHESGSKQAAPGAFMYVLGQVKAIPGWGPQDRFALEHLAAAALLSQENVRQTFTPWESIERGLKAFDDAYAVSGARYSTELREASPVSVKELGKRIGTWLQETSLDGDKKLFWPMELVDALVVARDEDVLDSGAAELVGKLDAALSDRDMFGKSFLTITPSALVTALKAGGVEADLSYDAVTIAGVTSKLPKPDHHDRLRRVGVTEEGRRLRYGYSER